MANYDNPNTDVFEILQLNTTLIWSAYGHNQVAAGSGLYLLS